MKVQTQLVAALFMLTASLVGCIDSNPVQPMETNERAAKTINTRDLGAPVLFTTPLTPEIKVAQSDTTKRGS